MHDDDERERLVAALAREHEQALGLLAVVGRPREAVDGRGRTTGEGRVERRERAPAAGARLEHRHLHGLVRRLLGGSDDAAVGAAGKRHAMGRAERRAPAPGLRDRAVERDRAAHRLQPPHPDVGQPVVTAPAERHHVELRCDLRRRSSARRDDHRRPRDHGAVAVEALDERHPRAVGRHHRRLQLPLGCVDIAALAPPEIEQGDAGVVPGALAGVFGDHRDRVALPGPVELPDVDAFGADLGRLATLALDAPEPAPGLVRPAHDRIGRLGVLGLDLGRRLPARAVRAGIGREHDERRAVGRPADRLDRAVHVAQRPRLAREVEQIRREQAGVIAVRGEGEHAPVGRPGGQRVAARPARHLPRIAVAVADPDGPLGHRALLVARRPHHECDAASIARDIDIRDAPQVQQVFDRQLPGHRVHPFASKIPETKTK